MALVSISEAAKLVGKARTTLYRAVASGRLSATTNATGETVIDIAELSRVYGEFRNARNSSATDASLRDATPDATSRISALEAEVTQLRERLADKDNHIADLRASIRLLESRTVPKTESRAWFLRIFR